ncbi:hypothetical protein M422DRAFT_275915 [Sphaerobolus stellatus SS14]|uniref:Uncharacterized protein n=1 Tax=Sphaerobolus stellatus (strain SS14) TaxID=990650 RepID=A0A0C9UDJ5_SPHS4|nr:hypothetical protein M422DRAFT_275915 [Sphaerobolus stellatus SS14]
MAYRFPWFYVRGWSPKVRRITSSTHDHTWMAISNLMANINQRRRRLPVPSSSTSWVVCGSNMRITPMVHQIDCKAGPQGSRHSATLLDPAPCFVGRILPAVACHHIPSQAFLFMFVVQLIADRLLLRYTTWCRANITQKRRWLPVPGSPTSWVVCGTFMEASNVRITLVVHQIECKTDPRGSRHSATMLNPAPCFVSRILPAVAFSSSVDVIAFPIIHPILNTGGTICLDEPFWNVAMPRSSIESITKDDTIFTIEGSGQPTTERVRKVWCHVYSHALWASMRFYTQPFSGLTLCSYVATPL